jgi:hypothetical protein
MQAEEKFKTWGRVDWLVEKMSEDKFKEMLCSVVKVWWLRIKYYVLLRKSGT